MGAYLWEKYYDAACTNLASWRIQTGLNCGGAETTAGGSNVDDIAPLVVTQADGRKMLGNCPADDASVEDVDKKAFTTTTDVNIALKVPDNLDATQQSTVCVEAAKATVAAAKTEVETIKA